MTTGDAVVCVVGILTVGAVIALMVVLDYLRHRHDDDDVNDN